MREQGFDPSLGVGRAWWQGAFTLWEIGVVMPQLMALRTAQVATHLTVNAVGAAGAAKAGPAFDAWQAFATQGLQVQQHLVEQAVGQWRQFWTGSLSRGGTPRHTYRATVVPVSNGRRQPAPSAQDRVVSGELLPASAATATNVRRLAPPKGAR
jgi:hypothetical protein